MLGLSREERNHCVRWLKSTATHGGKQLQVTGSKARSLLQTTPYTQACVINRGTQEVSHRVPARSPIFMASETWIHTGNSTRTAARLLCHPETGCVGDKGAEGQQCHRLCPPETQNLGKVSGDTEHCNSTGSVRLWRGEAHNHASATSQAGGPTASSVFSGHHAHTQCT